MRKDNWQSWLVKLDNEFIRRYEAWKRRDPDSDSLMRWADDGGIVVD